MWFQLFLEEKCGLVKNEFEGKYCSRASSREIPCWEETWFWWEICFCGEISFWLGNFTLMWNIIWMGNISLMVCIFLRRNICNGSSTKYLPKNKEWSTVIGQGLADMHHLWGPELRLSAFALNAVEPPSCSVQWEEEQAWAIAGGVKLNHKCYGRVRVYFRLWYC